MLGVLARMFDPRKDKRPSWLSWGVVWESLAMTYFHTGIRTIIGAESFHGPVRDGKGWYRLAMVTRL